MNDFYTFTEELMDEIKKKMGSEYEVGKEQIAKPNRIVTAITVKNKNMSTAPVFVAEDLYSDYKNGVSEEQIVENMKAAVIKTPELSKLGIEKENAKEHIRFSMMSIDDNREYLRNIPYEKVADLAAVPKWGLDDGMSFVMNNKICRQLEMTKEEVLDIAHSNLETEDFSVRSMLSIVGNAMGMFSEDSIEVSDKRANQLLVVSNKQGIDGAAEIINKKAMDEVRSRMGEDFVILPSSRHEVICIPKSSAGDIKNLQDMVKTVNRTTVDIKDRLSDNVYEYDGISRSVKLAGKEQVIQKAVPAKNKSMARGM